MKYQQLSVGLCIGFLAGIVISHFFNRSDTFTVIALNEYLSVKLNKRTGETWVLDSGPVWKPMPNKSQ